MRFVGVVVTLIWTSSSFKENKKSVNIRYEEKITSSDVQGFHTVNEEIYGKKKNENSYELMCDSRRNMNKQYVK